MLIKLDHVWDISIGHFIYWQCPFEAKGVQGASLEEAIKHGSVPVQELVA